jgi:Tfp pilus assembly protein PilO
VTARIASLSDGKKVALTAGVLLLVAIIGYFALIAPKRASAASLKNQAAAVQKQIDSNRSTAFVQALPAVRSANIFALTKAMPKQVQMPNVILQLSQLAAFSGITFDQVTPTPSGSSATSTATPTAPDTTDPFAVQPIQVSFTGTFYNLVSFLQRVRNLVRVENGHLRAYGRLFDVSDVEFCIPGLKASQCTTQPPKKINLPSPTGGARFIHVTLTINALVPQTPQSTTTGVPGSTDTTSTTTSTTTTGTTTTTSNSTSAAPSTSGGTS